MQGVCRIVNTHCKPYLSAPPRNQGGARLAKISEDGSQLWPTRFVSMTTGLSRHVDLPGAKERYIEKKRLKQSETGSRRIRGFVSVSEPTYDLEGHKIGLTRCVLQRHLKRWKQRSRYRPIPSKIRSERLRKKAVVDGGRS